MRIWNDGVVEQSDYTEGRMDERAVSDNDVDTAIDSGKIVSHEALGDGVWRYRYEALDASGLPLGVIVQLYEHSDDTMAIVNVLT